jgi:hypothetical protein
MTRINSWVKVDKVDSLEFSVSLERYSSAPVADATREVLSIRLMHRDIRNLAQQTGFEPNNQVRRLARSALEKSAVLPR